MKIFVRGDRTAVVTVESGYAVEALRSAVEGATGKNYLHNIIVALIVQRRYSENASILSLGTYRQMCERISPFSVL